MYMNLNLLRGAYRLLRDALDAKISFANPNLSPDFSDPDETPTVYMGLDYEKAHAIGILLWATGTWNTASFQIHADEYDGLRRAFAEARREDVRRVLGVETPFVLPDYVAYGFWPADLSADLEAKDLKKLEEGMSDEMRARTIGIFDRLVGSEVNELLDDAKGLIKHLSYLEDLGSRSGPPDHPIVD